MAANFIVTRYFSQLTILLFTFSPSAMAIDNGMRNPLGQLGCSRLLGGTYASVAKKLGLEFLMVTMRPDRFAQLMQAAGHSRPIFQASGVGVEDPGGRAVFSDPAGRYDHSMRPLLRADAGKWAHQLIGGRGDAIGMGVRSKKADHWDVGLIYPVEILDHIPFTITSTRSLRDRKLKTSTGRGGELFDSEKEYAQEQFEDILRDEIEFPPFPGSTDFADYFQFHFPQGVSLEFLALYWFPAPLVQAIGFDGNLPGLDSPLMPANGKPLQVTISLQDPGTAGGWTDVKPPSENLFEFFDPKRRVGTWFNVIPDWQKVRAELDKFPPPLPTLSYQFRAGDEGPKRIGKSDRKTE